VRGNDRLLPEFMLEIEKFLKERREESPCD